MEWSGVVFPSIHPWLPHVSATSHAPPPTASRYSTCPYCYARRRWCAHHRVHSQGGPPGCRCCCHCSLHRSLPSCYGRRPPGVRRQASMVGWCVHLTFTGRYTSGFLCSCSLSTPSWRQATSIKCQVLWILRWEGSVYWSSGAHKVFFFSV